MQDLMILSHQIEPLLGNKVLHLNIMIILTQPNIGFSHFVFPYINLVESRLI